MSTTVTIRDEEMSGKTVNEFSLDGLAERITVRELIRSRVYQEVKDHNARSHGSDFRGLVQPTGSERTLNGYRLQKPRSIDWKEQFAKALEAFNKNQVLILVNDRQVAALDEEIELTAHATVSFLRLTLLVGG